MKNRRTKVRPFQLGAMLILGVDRNPLLKREYNT